MCQRMPFLAVAILVLAKTVAHTFSKYFNARLSYFFAHIVRGVPHTHMSILKNTSIIYPPSLLSLISSSASLAAAPSRCLGLCFSARVAFTRRCPHLLRRQPSPPTVVATGHCRRTASNSNKRPTRLQNSRPVALLPFRSLPLFD